MVIKNYKQNATKKNAIQLNDTKSQNIEQNAT